MNQPGGKNNLKAEHDFQGEKKTVYFKRLPEKRKFGSTFFSKILKKFAKSRFFSFKK
jgi:hypothetical protein